MLTGPVGIDHCRLFDTFDPSSRRHVVAAVSGGSDSVALLLLLKAHLDRHAPRTAILAVTVDHGLRPESAAEAEAVAAICARLGVAHRILPWADLKPKTGLPAAAREARYRLLAQAALDAGTDVVFTGHTADDQAETVLMRARRGDGRGTAGMASETLFEGDVWILRPLLGTRRDTLRVHLGTLGIGWADDPTNADPTYERPRLRAALDEAGVVAALGVARETARLRLSLGGEAAALIGEHVAQVEPGLLRIDPRLLVADREPSLYALRVLLAVAGGTPQLPDAARSAGLFDRLGAGHGRAVLSRALADRRRDALYLLREARGLPLRPAAAGETWDRRYRIVAASGAAVEAGDDVPAALVRAARATLPVLREGLAAEPLMAPWATFLPSFDLAPARAVARLIGAREVPPAPSARHNGPEA